MSAARLGAHLPRTFRRIDDDATIGRCALSALAAELGTPLQVLDTADLDQRAADYVDGLATLERPARAVFATKALPIVSVVGRFAAHGIGADVTTAGELAVATAGGVPMRSVVHHGNARSSDELAAAARAGVGLVVLDGPQDVEHLDAVADRPVDVLVRITPGVAPATHTSMATAHHGQKFGVTVEEAPGLFAAVEASRHLRLPGHPLPRRLPDLRVGAVRGGRAAGVRSGLVRDPGRRWWARRPTDARRGGAVDADVPPRARRRDARRRVRARDRAHGRAGEVAGGAGDGHALPRPHREDDGGADVRRGRRRDVRRHRGRHWAPDAGAVRPRGRHDPSADAGRDALRFGRRARDRRGAARARAGALVAMAGTGAYTFSLASNYNATPRPAVVEVGDGATRTVVRRETVTDLLSRQVL